jgi:hypothetical protein
MGYEEAVAVLRSWLGDHVVVTLEPEGTVMRGSLSELDAGGADSAMFAVDPRQTTGVAVALFRDGVHSSSRQGDALVVQQGRMTVRVTREG